MQKYPVIESIINLVNEFKHLLESKNVEKVGEWIEKASNLKIRKIDKFVNGLKKIDKRLEMLLYMNTTMD